MNSKIKILALVYEGTFSFFLHFSLFSYSLLLVLPLLPFLTGGVGGGSFFTLLSLSVR